LVFIGGPFSWRPHINMRIYWKSALIFVILALLGGGCRGQGESALPPTATVPPPTAAAALPATVAPTPTPVLPEPTPSLAEPAAYPPPKNLVPTPTAVVTPRVTMTETVAGSDTLVRYQGDTGYGYPVPMIEVIFDRTLWAMPDCALSTPGLSECALVSTTVPGCTLSLREGPREYFDMGAVDLGGQQWNLAIPGPANAYFLIYSTQLENAAGIFRITLPWEGTIFDQIACRRAGEAVLKTFRVLER
jgi:hypothetical protein